MEAKLSHRTPEDTIGQSDHGLVTSIPHGFGPSISSDVGDRPSLVRPAIDCPVTNDKVTAAPCGVADTAEGACGVGNGQGVSISNVELAKLHRQTQQKAKKMEWLKRHKGEVYASELEECEEECVQENLISIGNYYWSVFGMLTLCILLTDDPEFWEKIISTQEPIDSSDKSSSEEVEPKHKRQKTVPI